MKTAPRMLLLALALTGWAAADLPKKAPVTKYSRLWTDSPFTSKPPPQEIGPIANPLEDWTLIGVSPIKSGHRVTIMNKKDPTQRVAVETNKTVQGFKILSVDRKADDSRATVVRMQSDSSTGTVAYEEKYLTLAPPPAAKKTAPKLPPGIVPGQIPGQPQIRQPRPRVVPPPTPKPATPTSGQRSFQRPTSTSSSHSRPDRRSR
jgi:hypothetical protein